MFVPTCQWSPYKLYWSTLQWKKKKERILSLKQHITNYMLSSFLNYVYFSDYHCCLRADTDGTVEYIQAFFILLHVRQQFMLRLGRDVWLFNLPIWGWLHHLFWLSNLHFFFFSLQRECQCWGLRGDMQILNCTSRTFYFNHAHALCSRAEQMFNLHPYYSQSADSCGSHNLFPDVTLVAQAALC